MIFALIFMLLHFVIPFEDEFEGDEDYTQKFEELQKDVIKGANFTFRNIFFQKINIMLIGITGVGKSFLINHLFRHNFTKSDIGKPVTNNVQHFTKEGNPLTIIDIPGFEHDPKKIKKTYNLIFSTIKKLKTANISNYVHCIFYCVSCESKRFEDFDANIIRKLCNDPRRGKIPVILVLTQCYDDEVRDKMIETIKKENLGISEIIPILAGKKVIGHKKHKIVIPSYGVSNLIDAVGQYLPDVLYEALNTFRYDHRYRKYFTKFIILGSVAMACDYSTKDDLIGVTLTQFSMILGINYVYGIDASMEFIAYYYKWIIGIDLNSNATNNKMQMDLKKIMEILKDILNIPYLKYLPAFARYKEKIENTMVNSMDMILSLVTLTLSSSGISPIMTYGLGECYVRYIENIYFNYDPNITIDDIRKSIEEDYKSIIAKL